MQQVAHKTPVSGHHDTSDCYTLKGYPADSSRRGNSNPRRARGNNFRGRGNRGNFGGRGGTHQSPNTNSVTLPEEEPVNHTEGTYMADVGTYLSENSESQLNWLLDTACARHLTPDESDFVEIRPCNRKMVMGNGTTTPVHGIGTLRLTLSINGRPETVQFTNAYWVPQFKAKLLPLGQLEPKGVSYRKGPLGLELYNETTGATIVQTRRLPNNLYEILMQCTPMSPTTPLHLTVQVNVARTLDE
ncbi:hypothetical protein TWF481_002880 [Arthrobotrys musiformis]|uniref:Retrovirus-related Pol polyprotein from transposon TNT 1-94-like beta-barrel domain-containing protein n=1 Tax=Arthrobotrys musiformis TaxID=47236 RepID=A0AAV9VXM4_9PEZI